MIATNTTAWLWVMLALAIVPAPALAQIAPPAVAPLPADNWQIGTSSSFLSGRYGTETRTTVFYTPTTARRLFADGDLTLVFPFTCIKGDGGVTVVGGSPVRTQRGTPGPAPTRSGDTDRTGRIGDAPVAAASGAATAPATTCGMGDVVVRGRYYLLDERGWMPTIALRAHVKAPTADAAQNLGTGKADEGIGVEISRAIAGGVVAMADTGYTVIGQPADTSYQNNWWYDVGVANDIANGVANVSVFFEEYRSILPGLPTARDILVSLMIKGGTGWRLQLSGQFGLSDGAPDRGLTLGASRRF